MWIFLFKSSVDNFNFPFYSITKNLFNDSNTTRMRNCLNKFYFLLKKINSIKKSTFLIPVYFFNIKKSSLTKY